MTIQLSDTLRNNMISQYETTIGTSAKLRLLTGSPPANVAAAETGTLLVELTLPVDWMAAASGGSIAKSGTWQQNGSTAGTAGYYRLTTSAGTAHEQGTVGVGTGDLQVDQAVVAVGQPVTITAWNRTQSGA